MVERQGGRQGEERFDEREAVGVEQFRQPEEVVAEVRYDPVAVAEEYLARLADAVNLTPDQEERIQQAVKPRMSPEEALVAVHDACLHEIGYLDPAAVEANTEALKREEVRAARYTVEEIRLAWERQGDFNPREWRQLGQRT